MKVIWSEEAVTDYHQNIDYLLREWSEQVAMEFIEDVQAVVDLIKNHPALYPLTGYKGVRKAVIRKQITLFFKADNDEVHLIRFWNNYQDIGRLKL